MKVIKFIKDTEKAKAGDIGEASDKSAESYVKNGYAEYVDKSNNSKAFERFNECEILSSNDDKHQHWLGDYEGLYFSIGEKKFDKIKWQEEKDKYVYSNKRFGEPILCLDGVYRANPNKIQRHPKRIIIEFDEERNSAQERLLKVKEYFRQQGWGFIHSSHNSENGSDYLWLEFNRDITDEEAEKFIKFISDRFGGKIDLNFASSNRRFPVLFAVHWKYPKERELPVDYFEGEQINIDSLKIPKPKGKVKTTVKDGGSYKNYVNVNKNTATPTLPATTYYIKSWGYFDKNKKIHIEQITPKLYIYNSNGVKNLIEVQEFRDSTKLIYNYFDIDDVRYILPKYLFEAKLFYNIPSIDLCEKFINGSYKPRSYTEISDDIKKMLKEMFDFNDEVDIEMTNLHISQSWIKPLLNNFFFYMIDSSLGGGKTTLGEIVYFLNRHGFVGGNISSASIPRLTNELDLNIFVDEIDQNLKDDDTLAVLRKGQRRGNPYVRCEGRDNRPVAYDVAGCHGGSYRSELEDAFMNRSLRVHTKKTSDYMLPVVNSAKKDILKPLADELFFWHLDNLVATCSEEEGVARTSKPRSRKELYQSLTSNFTEEEKEFLSKVFGRDNELTYLCLETARTLKIEVLEHLKTIMSNKARDEASSEGFYIEALKHLITISFPRVCLKTLKDGLNIGYPYYPKSRLYQEYMGYLKEINVSTIGTKKYSSLLRDLGFIEGQTITSQRYDNYPTPCLIFNKTICSNLSIDYKPIRNEVLTQ